MTEHAEIGTYFDAPLCAGSIARVDESIARYALLLDAVSSQKVRIYWGADGVMESCDVAGLHDTLAGCHIIGKNETFADSGSLEHELVHAVGDRIGGMDSFFEEGLAEALSGGIGPAPDFERRPSSFVGLSTADFIDTPGSRSTSRHFVQFLIDERGMEPLNELRPLALRGTTRDQVLEAFHAVYDTPIEALEDAWVERAPLSYEQLGDLALPEDQWRGDELTIQRTLDCDDVSTMGPLDGVTIPEDFAEQEGMYQRITFDVADEDSYNLDLQGSGARARVREEECWIAADDAPNELELGADVPVETNMGACRFSATLWVEGTTTTAVTLTIRRIEKAG